MINHYKQESAKFLRVESGPLTWCFLWMLLFLDNDGFQGYPVYGSYKLVDTISFVCVALAKN